MPKSLAFVLLVLLTANCFAQNNRRWAYAVWPSVAVQYAPAEKVELSLESCTKLQLDLLQLDETYIQAGLDYALSPKWDIGLNYRFSEVYSPRTQFTANHRLMGTVDYKLDAGRWKIRLRNAFEYSPVFAANGSDAESPWCYRPRIKAAFNIKGSKHEPFASVELFASNIQASGFSFYKYRATVGVDLRIKKGINCALFVRNQSWINNYQKKSWFIAGFDLSFKLKSK